MKKLLILILFVLFIPIVCADMGAPQVREYEVYIDKEEGIDYYTIIGNSLVSDGHLDKDEVLKISFEYNENDIDYLYFTKGLELSGYVKASDVIIKEKSVTPKSSGVIRNPQKTKYRVYADMVVVRSGPSIVYDEVGKLEKGMEGYYEYIPDTDQGSGYIYIEEGDLKGWINTLDNAVLTIGKDYYFVKDYELSCGVIPANTIMNGVWMSDSWSRNILLTYGDCEELVKFDKDVPFVLVDFEVPSYVRFNKEVSVYDYPTNQRSTKIKITKGNEVAVFAKYPSYPSENELFYVEYKGIRGWTERVKSVDYEYVLETEDSKEVEIDDKENEIIEDKKDVNEEKPKDESTSKDTSKIDSKTMIIICVISSVTVALVVLIVIILINKKKKCQLTSTDNNNVL